MILFHPSITSTFSPKLDSFLAPEEASTSNREVDSDAFGSWAEQLPKTIPMVMSRCVDKASVMSRWTWRFEALQDRTYQTYHELNEWWLWIWMTSAKSFKVEKLEMEIGRSFQCEWFGSHEALGLSLVENWNWNKLGSQSASKTWSSETLEEVFGEQAVCIYCFGVHVVHLDAIWTHEPMM